VVGLGLEHGQPGVGEHGVVAVSGEQLALGRREAGGVEAFHPADDQPPRDVLVGAFAGERGVDNSNARSEGYNRLAKHEGRNAFGFRNPTNQRRRIGWACTRQHRQVSATITELPGQVR